MKNCKITKFKESFVFDRQYTHVIGKFAHIKLTDAFSLHFGICENNLINLVLQHCVAYIISIDGGEFVRFMCMKPKSLRKNYIFF